MNLENYHAKGCFGIGIYQPKNKENIGTLWRSAYQLGASFLFIIGKRYGAQPTDTCKSTRHIPLIQYRDLQGFKENPIYNMPIVAVEKFRGVEYTSTPLIQYTHPKNCIYLLGAEDYGLDDDVLSLCTDFVEIESVRDFSYNVSVAGSLLMYDRLRKNFLSQNNES